MAHLGAILKHPNMFGLRVIATGLYTIGSRLQANIVTSLQVLHALLKFYPNQRVFRILLHNSLSFLLLLEKTILPVLPSQHLSSLLRQTRGRGQGWGRSPHGHVSLLKCSA